MECILFFQLLKKLVCYILNTVVQNSLLEFHYLVRCLPGLANQNVNSVRLNFIEKPLMLCHAKLGNWKWEALNLNLTSATV